MSPDLRHAENNSLIEPSSLRDFRAELLHSLGKSSLRGLNVLASLGIACSCYQLPIISTQLAGLANGVVLRRALLRSELCLRSVVWLPLLSSVDRALPSTPKGVGMLADKLSFLALFR